MPELNRNGHRARMRESYLNGSYENLPDHNLLELYLSIIIPQKDVKELAYELINTFGSIENVFNASIDDLLKIDGVGESSAIAISLVNDINKRIQKNKNNDVEYINSTKTAFKYCENLLKSEKTEKILIVTLANNGSIINNHILNEGSVSSKSVDLRAFVECAIRDNAPSILISHNHPNGLCEPSASDINFSQELKHLLKKINIELIDHIIVGKDESYSLTAHKFI